MRFRLLMIALLALVSNACASAKPQYYSGATLLIPPVSITAPATPRPPLPSAVHGDADVVIDDVQVTWPEGMEPEATPRPPLPVSASNNLKGKLNKGLAPYVKLDWSAGSKQSATAPVAVAKVTSTTPRPSMRNTQELQQQINNLLAQIDSLQNAELKAVQTERDKALSDYILSKQETAILERDRNKVRSLIAAKRRGDMQWNVINENGHAAASDYAAWWVVFTLVFLGVVFFLGWRIGKTKAEGVASARITELKKKVEEKNDLLVERNRNHESEARALRGEKFDLRQEVAEKDRRIEELQEEVKKKRRRVQQVKRQRAGPIKTPSEDLSSGPTRALPKDPPDLEFAPLPRTDL